MNGTSWKEIDIEYGKEYITVKVPPYCEILENKSAPPLARPREKIEEVLSNPVGTESMEKLIGSLKKDPSKIKVAITVSDNTRPVPYNGESEQGILLPLLRRLEKARIKRGNIKIIVGTGTHLPTSSEWKKEAFGEFILNNYEIIDHDCNALDLISIGRIRGVEVKINKEFITADIRIATGLVEPHFMAGVSGGRKAICPGLVNLEATYVFHGVDFMDHPNATNMVLVNNPCHEFALEVAKRAKVDFIVNCTINGNGDLTGVFAGHFEKAHLQAVRMLKDTCVVHCSHEYDIVLTQGGKVAVNHYQAAKAAYATIPIVKKGGIVILIAHNSDKNPVGKDEYRRVLRVLKEKGPGKFTEYIKSKNWRFVPDQWQVQKWDQFFKKIGFFDNLIYCTTNIPPHELEELPGKSGYLFAKEEALTCDRMVQNAIYYAVDNFRQKLKREPAMAFIKEGPYTVPLLNLPA